LRHTSRTPPRQEEALRPRITFASVKSSGRQCRNTWSRACSRSLFRKSPSRRPLKCTESMQQMRLRHKHLTKTGAEASKSSARGCSMWEGSPQKGSRRSPSVLRKLLSSWLPLLRLAGEVPPAPSHGEAAWAASSKAHSASS